MSCMTQSVYLSTDPSKFPTHRTPEPCLIDKAGSPGCVRLTNCDAEELAGMVKQGVAAKFID